MFVTYSLIFLIFFGFTSTSTSFGVNRSLQCIFMAKYIVPIFLFHRSWLTTVGSWCTGSSGRSTGRASRGSATCPTKTVLCRAASIPEDRSSSWMASEAKTSPTCSALARSDKCLCVKARSHCAIFPDCDCDSSYHSKLVVQDSLEVFTPCDYNNNHHHYKNAEKTHSVNELLKWI